PLRRLASAVVRGCREVRNFYSLISDLLTPQLVAMNCCHYLFKMAQKTVSHCGHTVTRPPCSGGRSAASGAGGVSVQTQIPLKIHRTCLYPDPL
ncbi:hypothetical protein AVEN_130575-1, partial [Araneus ventricosus]